MKIQDDLQADLLSPIQGHVDKVQGGALVRRVLHGAGSDPIAEGQSDCIQPDRLDLHEIVLGDVRPAVLLQGTERALLAKDLHELPLAMDRLAVLAQEAAEESRGGAGLEEQPTTQVHATPRLAPTAPRGPRRRAHWRLDHGDRGPGARRDVGGVRQEADEEADLVRVATRLEQCIQQLRQDRADAEVLLRFEKLLDLLGKARVAGHVQDLAAGRVNDLARRLIVVPQLMLSALRVVAHDPTALNAAGDLQVLSRGLVQDAAVGDHPLLIRAAMRRVHDYGCAIFAAEVQHLPIAAADDFACLSVDCPLLRLAPGGRPGGDFWEAWDGPIGVHRG
mmetsp:Transcript_12026/g.34647  ORF Transcript_12026/g.34647 Transcript_12026/m.34647 type:complete len:335 (+) Transcript_12026:1429-2433(+)